MHHRSYTAWKMSILMLFSAMFSAWWAAPVCAAPDVAARRAKGPLRPGYVATPIPKGAEKNKKPFPPEEPGPRHKLEADLAALNDMIELLETKDDRFERKLIGPTLLFGAGCGVSLLGLIVTSVFPTMAANGLLFGAPTTWLVVGVLVALAGFALVVGGGVWHAPISRRRKPVSENLLELKARRKHLLKVMARQRPRHSALHLPMVAHSSLHVAF